MITNHFQASIEIVYFFRIIMLWTIVQLICSTDTIIISSTNRACDNNIDFIEKRQ